MYEKILVALDATAADHTILEHVTKLALTFNSSLVLLHVADGWAARLFGAEAASLKSRTTKRIWNQYGRGWRRLASRSKRNSLTVTPRIRSSDG